MRNQDRLIQIYLLLLDLRLKKMEPYLPIKAASKHSLKGKGLCIIGYGLLGWDENY